MCCARSGNPGAKRLKPEPEPLSRAAAIVILSMLEGAVSIGLRRNRPASLGWLDKTAQKQALYSSHFVNGAAGVCESQGCKGDFLETLDTDTCKIIANNA